MTDDLREKVKVAVMGVIRERTRTIAYDQTTGGMIAEAAIRAVLSHPTVKGWLEHNPTCHTRRPFEIRECSCGLDKQRDAGAEREK